MKTALTVVGALLLALHGTGFAADSAVKNQAEGVKGKVREGKTGTSNENAARQMKDLEKQEKADSRPASTPTPTPSGKK